MVNRLSYLLIVLLWAHPGILGAQPTGSIRGVVRATPTLIGLPYAVVSIPARNLERFSGADGLYVLTNVPAGEHQVQVRRVGFVPRTVTVRVDAGSVATLDIHLDQVPVRLAGMIVNPVQPCLRPGLPDSATNREVWQMVASLRENAATYKVLVTQHPFGYAQARAFGQLVDTIAELRSIDSIVVPGTADDNYRPGRIVSTNRRGMSRETVMRIPTIVELASKAFVSNHCFTYGGAGVYGNETWYRLDMRAADRLRSPDVHGAAYLDSATSQLRRLDLELSRTDRLPSEFRGVRTVRAITTFMEIAPGLAIIDGVCAVNWLKGFGNNAGRHPIELQQSVAYEFRKPPPDVSPSGRRDAPAWRRGQPYARSSLSCASDTD